MDPLDGLVVGPNKSFKSIHGKYLSAYANGVVSWSATGISANECFEVIPLGGNWYNIRTASGKYLCAEHWDRIVGSRAVALEWERFRIELVRPGVFGIKTYHGAYLSAQPGGWIQCNRPALREWEWISILGDGDPRTLRLYHETNLQSAELIIRSQRMHVGTARDLMFGKAIYFAGNPKLAGRKSRHHGVVLVADVNLGRTLSLDRPNSTLSLARMEKLGYQSVMGRAGPAHPWEYAVYNPAQVTNIRRA
jgi:hypothetical protein